MTHGANINEGTCAKPPSEIRMTKRFHASKAASTALTRRMVGRKRIKTSIVDQREEVLDVRKLDQFGIRSHGCPWCHTDLTDSIRAHLYGCAMLPAEVRRRAQAAREASRSLVKQSGQLNDRADVLLREAETALYARRDTMRQPPARRGTKPPREARIRVRAPSAGNLSA